MSLKSKVLRGVAWSTTERVVRQGLSFVVYAVMARILSPADFGLVALALVYTTFMELFVNQGFATAIVRRKEVDRGHLDTAFWISLAVAIVLALGTFAMAPWLSQVFSAPDLTPVLRALGFVLVIASFGVVPSALLSRDMHFDKLAIASVASALVSGSVGLGCAYAGMGAWALVAQQLSGAATGALCLWLACRWVPGFHASRSHFNDLRNFGWALMGNNVLFFIARKSDEAIIGKWLNVTALGVYSLGNRLSTTVLELLTAPSAVVALPAMSRKQDDPKALSEAFVEGTHFICAVSFPALLGLILVAPDAVPVIFGNQWAASVPVVQILCLVGILRAAHSMVHSCFLAKGQTWTYSVMFVVYVVVTLIASLIAVRTRRAEMVAWAQVISTFITGAANFVVLRRSVTYSVGSLLGGWARIGVPCGVMGMGVLLIQHQLHAMGVSRVIVLSTCCAAGIVFYAACGLITLRGEVSKILGMIRRGGSPSAA